MLAPGPADDLIIAADGFSREQGGVEERTARLYILSVDADVRPPLRGEHFVPGVSGLAGGAIITVRGSGFDAGTTLFFGDRECEAFACRDSRTLLARIPRAAAAGFCPVELRRGSESFLFPDFFEYVAGSARRERDVATLGANGCVITSLSPAAGFEETYARCVGGEDVTGDGFADVLIKHQPGPERIAPDEISILPGGRDLPLAFDASAVGSWGTTIYSTERDDMFGDTAIMPGDMTGDGVSELVVSAFFAHKIYVILGGPLTRGRVSIQELVARTRAYTILGALDTLRVHFKLVKIGDLDGDGRADLGIVNSQPCPVGSLTYSRGSVSFLLGGGATNASVDFAALPRVMGVLSGLPTDFRESAPLGDVDGDGYDDVFLPPCVFFGRRDLAGAATLDQEIGEGCALFLWEPGTLPEDRYLSSPEEWRVHVHGMGDQNGDGKDDIGIVAVPWREVPDTARSRLFVVYGRAREDFGRTRRVAEDGDFDAVFPATQLYNGSLAFLAGGRDLDGDGVADILLPDRHLGYAPPPARAIILRGGDLAAKSGPLECVKFAYEFINRRSLPADADTNLFPSRFEFAGDVDGDGREDLVIADQRTIYVCFNPFAPALTRLSPRDLAAHDVNGDKVVDLDDALAILAPPQSSKEAGNAGSGAAGDVNGDGVADLRDAQLLVQGLFSGIGRIRNAQE